MSPAEFLLLLHSVPEPWPFPAQLGAVTVTADVDADAPHIDVAEKPDEPPKPTQKQLAERHAQIYDNVYDLPAEPVEDQPDDDD